MIKVYSSGYDAIRKRIAKLPKELNETIMAKRKLDAIRFIELFQEGIRDDIFGLERLKEITQTNKKALGYTKPDTPLYGKGDDDKASFINMLRIRKVKTGWVVFPSWAKHHSANMQLRQLLIIHEYGAIVRGTKINKKTGMQEQYLIRIPPRPALTMAYMTLLKERRDDSREQAIKVKKAIHDFITGASSRITLYREQWDKRSNQYDET